MTNAPLLLIAALAGAAGPPDAPAGRTDRVQSRSFEIVDAGAPVSLVYTLVNDLARPLRVVDHKYSCGCVQLTEAPTEIAPGATGRFVCAVDTKALRGRVNQIVTLRTDRPDDPMYGFQIRGIVRAVWFEPQPVDFGTVNRGEVPHRQVVVLAAGFSSARVEAVEVADPSALKAEILPARVSSVHEEMGIAAVARLELDWSGHPVTPGPYRTELIVRTNVSSTPVLRVPVTAHVSGASRVTPPKLLFGSVQPRRPVTRTCSIRLDEPPDELVRGGLTFASGRPGVTARVEKVDALARMLEVSVIIDIPGEAEAGLASGQVEARRGDRVVFSIPYLMFLNRAGAPGRGGGDDGR